tara:strand:- start:2937 stop:3086 length:150 start_codon:yes stop_codon:yes gene_type:complete
MSQKDLVMRYKQSMFTLTALMCIVLRAGATDTLKTQAAEVLKARNEQGG